MVKEVIEIIEKIKEECKETKLYKEMTKRKGNFAIHKGSYTPNTLFIGEAPGYYEDRNGTPFIGKSGTILDNWIKDNKIENYAVINAIPIMPTNEEMKIRKPTKQEINYHRIRLLDLINALNPKKIILIGRSAEEAYLGKSNLLKNKEWNTQVGFIYHPSYYLRNGTNGDEDFEELIKNGN